MSEINAVAILVLLGLGVTLLLGILITARAAAANIEQLVTLQRQISVLVMQLQKDSLRSTGKLDGTLERVVELQEATVGRLHKIAIHYAPYLRTHADAMHEQDHRDNVHHDLDMDSLLRQEEKSRQAHFAATPPEWAKDITAEYAGKKHARNRGSGDA